jgi:uncharacterized membrane protein YedE/YeeE
MKHKIYALLIGIYFGIVLVKSQVVSWFQIHDMFLFKSPYMYLVIASAVVTGIISIQIIRYAQTRTLDGEPIVLPNKTFHPGLVYGSTLFGIGWAITGACPGPIYAQIGSGALLAIFTFAGALAGMYLYAYLQPYLPEEESTILRFRLTRLS